MNPIEDNARISDDHRFDLLVDGELSEPERRRLLAGLDDEPGGWRQCALAFLEAQLWKQEFGAIVGEPAGKPPPKRAARRSRLGRYTGTLLAMAASFLAALLLGSLLQGVWRPGSPTGRPSINEFADTGRPEGLAPKVKSPSGPQPGAPRSPEALSSPLWVVEVPGRQGPEGESATIPLLAIERDQIDESWLERLPAAMPRNVVQALERAGLRVQQRRELLPLPLEDGRQLVVPVDEVDIHYVGKPAL